MKKFTKGCLITALVLFVLGCAFYIICGVMGGFGQLKAWNGHTFHMWGHEMRLAYSGYGFWYITDADADSERKLFVTFTSLMVNISMLIISTI